MQKKKLYTLVGSLALVGAIGVGATLAYFTDNDVANNVITMGHVDIELDEPNYDPGDDGVMDDLTPGDWIVKDPTITVKADSEDAYIRAKVDISIEDGIMPGNLYDSYVEKLEENIMYNNNWVKGVDGYYYFQSVIGKTNVDQKFVLFEGVTIPKEWGNEIADATIKIDVTAEAIQADNFTPGTNDEGQINSWGDVDITEYQN